MDFIVIKDFFNLYGLNTIIISVIIGVITLILDLIFKKVSLFLTYLPFILGVIISVVFTYISENKISFSAEVISSGLICGSLSLIISAFFKSLPYGKTKNAKLLIIEEVLSDLFKDKLEKNTAKLIFDYIQSVENSIVDENIIKEIIIKNGIDGITEDYAIKASALIVNSIKSISL